MPVWPSPAHPEPMKVATVMSTPVVTVSPEAPVKAAARLLIEHQISALPVIDEAGELVGIVSEADLIPLETRPDPRAQATPIPPTAGSAPRRVSDVMTRQVVTTSIESDVSEAARRMIERDVKRLPVMDGRRLAGILSRRDLVKILARRDEDVQAELRRRLLELGLGLSGDAVNVGDGVARIRLQSGGHARRLAESVALTVPGVMEVRFTT